MSVAPLASSRYGEDRPGRREKRWSGDPRRKFLTVAVLAGATAELFGDGGGMAIVPFFITLDMQPKVGSSFCAFMILWTALSGVV